MKNSELIHRILVLVIGGGVLAFVFWGGMQLFSSKFVPVSIPSRKDIRFEPKREVWENTLFSSLQGFFTGNVTPGALGKSLPFEGGAGSQQQLLQGQVSPLASMEEISLAGARAVSVSRSSDGTMAVLLSSPRPAGGDAYEIRLYAADQSATTFAAWQTGPTDPVVWKIAASNDGSVWLGGTSGYIARCEKNGTPTPILPESTGLHGNIQDIAIDGAGRVWATDRTALALGGVDSFAPFDFSSRLRAEEQRALLNELSKMPDAPSVTSDADQQALLKTALHPYAFSVLANGEIGLNTKLAAFVFPLALQNSIRWIDTGLPASMPLAFDPNGGVFTLNAATHQMQYVWATGTRLYASEATPSAVPSSAFANGLDGVYALSNSASSTVLWIGRSGNWVAQIVAASGTISAADGVAQAAVDGSGTFWATSPSGKLLHVRKGSGL